MHRYLIVVDCALGQFKFAKLKDKAWCDMFMTSENIKDCIDKIQIKNTEG